MFSVNLLNQPWRNAERSEWKLNVMVGVQSQCCSVSYRFTNILTTFFKIEYSVRERERVIYAHFIILLLPSPSSRSTNPPSSILHIFERHKTATDGTCSTKHFQLVEQLISKRDRLGFNLIRRHFPMSKNWTGSTGCGTSSSCPVLCHHFRADRRRVERPWLVAGAGAGVAFAIRPSFTMLHRKFMVCVYVLIISSRLRPFHPPGLGIVTCRSWDINAVSRANSYF